MKEVIVTFKLKVKDDALIEHVIDNIHVDLYGCIEELVYVEGSIVQTNEEINNASLMCEV
jgi:hypothetical protein